MLPICLLNRRRCRTRSRRRSACLALGCPVFCGDRGPFVELEVAGRTLNAAPTTGSLSNPPHFPFSHPMIQHRANGVGISGQSVGDLRQGGRASAEEVAFDVHQHCRRRSSGERLKPTEQIPPASRPQVPGTTATRGNACRLPRYRIKAMTPLITIRVRTIQKREVAGSRPNRAVW